MPMRRERLRRHGDFGTESMPLTPRDRELLQPLIDRAREPGYAPAVAEGSEASRIQARFHCWKDALPAAGLPSEKSAEQVQGRRQAKQ